MTSTPAGTTRARKTTKGKGLVMKRRFSTEGIHPYDEVKWVRKDVVQTDWRTGTINFEQRQVEFPAFWSDNAVTITTTKYFRGKEGSEGRESSLRQLIDRIVDTYVAAGVENKYFASKKDADIFSDELKWLLLNQHFAFNSPVWFNVGTKSPQQVSACQPYDALVSTPNGPVPIGKLVEDNAVGTEVLSAKGVTKIVAVKNNGIKKVIRIHTKAGHQLDVTEDHLVWRSATANSGRFVPAGSLKPNDKVEWHRYVNETTNLTDLDKEITSLDVAGAALAGWLQSDGFVGKYATGTNKSLTIETITINDAELKWVTTALDTVFPDCHRKERSVVTKDTSLDLRRTRLYGAPLKEFVDSWNLLPRGLDMEIPERLFTSPLNVVTAYLRSIFQAEGFVSARVASTMVEVDMVSEKLIRGMQTLLTRYGIFSRVGFKEDKRDTRHGCYTLCIQNKGDRERFAQYIGFIDPIKTEKLNNSLNMNGKAAGEIKRLEIKKIESLNAVPVYDIQTESSEYLSNGLRVHNCFILAVDDTMDAILNWYKEEGLIFKGGSGAGLNLSNIRSSKEFLSSGGNASGPVSFMRGADASAGTIKSGGSTRRAAKMIVLDVDHPDIEEFVETKVREEDKIRALRDAGFDMDLGGKDIVSVQYQNANNSVRVDDTFMRAVQNKDTYPLIARSDGSVIEEVDAAELFTKIAAAAWACADPGIQYKDTINSWHTNPETGPITASNPCSEYLSLDNSSCNLASINLLKFYNEETGFDVEAYTSAVETIITAMDISICFGHFPTEKITKTTHDYRQLGIGYSNLGALLMTVGMPYDSEEGRMFAGGITSLMSAAAWRRSSELANIVGPYNGYKQNKTAHTNVIERHVQENAHAQTTSKTSQGAYIYNAAATEWNKALTLGKKHGWRNAQTSLLAPTGTISFLMDCDTTGIEPDFSLVKHKKLVGGGSMKIVNQGVERALRNLGYNEHIIETAIEHVAQTGVIIGAPFIKEEHYDVFDCAVGERAISPDGHIHMMAAAQPFLSGSISKCVTGETLLFSADGLIRISSLYENEKPDNFRPLTMEVASQEGFQKTDAFYYGGLRNIKKLTTRSGHTIKGTPNHKVLVGNKDGLVWKTLAEIKPGDYVTHKYGTNIWSQTQASLRGFTPSASYGNQKTVTIPTEMTEELALLLGAYASEGHVTRSTWTVVITNSCEEVLEKVVSAWKNVFGVDAKITRDKDKCPGVIVHSKTIVEFLKYLNCGSVAANKRIPDAVLTSPKNVILEYLKGLALDAYTADVGTSIKWAILLDSKELLNDLQAVLTNLGIVHSRVSKYSKEYDKYFDEVYTTGENAAKMIKLVPFMENYKKEKADKRAKRTFGGSTSSIVPGLRSKELYDLLPYGTKDEKGVLIRTKFSYLNDPRTLHASRETLEKLADVPQMELPDWLNQVLKENLHFSPVESIEDAGKELVYDISVPDSHAFVANGIVNHNTVNIPEESTIEDIERIYMEGWKLGLKAIAVYRDNCKVGQPLSTKEAKQNDIGETNVVPIRRRLPQTRNSKTTKFVIGGIEGYLTTGEYDDGTLGEIFIRVSKQGSTLSGMMDGLAMAVSVGLQYGVPLETFVAKYINSSFDPAGMTTDVDIRIAKSLLDYMFRRLAIEYLTTEIRQGYGIYTIEERTESVENGYNDTPRPAIVETKPSVTSHELDVPMCQTCGTSTYMQRSGSCYACTSCGNTTGCS